MTSNIFQTILRFIFLVALQVLILNNVGFNGYINPYLYVLFIVALPFETPKWLSLLSAFTLGFCIDIFTQTIGMHIMATLFMVFIRQLLLDFLAPKDGYEFGLKPTIPIMGFSWFAFYAGILVVAHHLVLFLVEAFSFAALFSTIGRALLSSVFTLLLIFIVQMLVYKRK